MQGLIKTGLAVLAAAVLCFSGAAFSQPREMRIGVIYDRSGPLAAGGSEAADLGTRIAIDMINERGGIEGYRISPVYVDAQSRAETAVAEAERLLAMDRIELVMGVFSNTQCAPIAERAEAAKKVFWTGVCPASSLLKGRNLQYTFRAQPHSDQYGETSCRFIHEMSRAKLGVDPRALRVAVIHEDGPYGTGIAQASEEACGKLGIRIAFREGYEATTPDLAGLVGRLRGARPDIILHAGYNPDITLFLQQSREQGLKFKALIGHGAGYSQIDKLAAAFGPHVNYLFDVDPVAAQLLEPEALKPGVGELAREMLRRYQAVKGPGEVPPYASLGFNQAWILLSDVLPRAIRKYGGPNAEAIRRAALETDIPAGGSVQGYGVKFPPPGNVSSGQNERASMAVMQFVNGRSNVAWPKALRTVDPVMPFPKGHAYAP